MNFCSVKIFYVILKIFMCKFVYFSFLEINNNHIPVKFCAVDIVFWESMNILIFWYLNFRIYKLFLVHCSYFNCFTWLISMSYLADGFLLSRCFYLPVERIRFLDLENCRIGCYLTLWRGFFFEDSSCKRRSQGRRHGSYCNF